VQSTVDGLAQNVEKLCFSVNFTLFFTGLPRNAYHWEMMPLAHRKPQNA
jgi:hypothetical protein